MSRPQGGGTAGDAGPPGGPWRERYLDLLKAALLDEHYLDDEVRIDYLLSLAGGQRPDLASLRDPARTLPLRYEQLARTRRAGHVGTVAPHLELFPYTTCGRAALDHLQTTVDRLLAAEVPGDVVDCGVGRGGVGIFLRGCLLGAAVAGAHAAVGADPEPAVDVPPDRTVWVVDPFTARSPGVDPDAPAPPGTDARQSLRVLRPDLNQVRDAYHRMGLLDGAVRFVQGPYDQTLIDAPIGPLAILHLGRDLGADLEVVLRRLLPRVVAGGAVVVEGAGRPEVADRLAAVRRDLGSSEVPVQVGWNVLSWTVARPTASTVPTDTDTDTDTDGEVGSGSGGRLGILHRPPIVGPGDRAPASLDLSVVVVFYDMRREAPRTLHSLSRAYQQGVEDLSYEVVVLENGSPEEHRLTRGEVEAHGPEFRFIDLAETATPSPTTALNRGIAEARGEVVAVMIDGAHVLTPGVLRLGVAGMRTYAPAFVSTQQWYVGPGQQSEAQMAGYDQAMEDRLFERIGWPDDGYRLFEVGDFIGDRDWFDGMFESNCLFVSRDLLDQIGGFDDSFDMGGGGYANLDLYERVAQHPGINAVTILGEGSFHQFHGGTTTNVAELAQRRRKVAGYGRHFAELRGRALVGNMNPMYYLGSLASRGSRRIRARGDLVLNPNPARDPVATTDVEPTLVPDQLKVATIGAVWGSQAWRQATWLGRPVNRYPADLQAYQELTARTRPDAVLLLADDDGLAGRALFLAAVCDGIGHGGVLAVGPPPADPVEHSRLRWFPGRAEEAEVVAAVRGQVRGGTAMVVIGLGPNDRIDAAFEAYQDLIPSGGYAVVENTILNGRPVAAAFGAGPSEAAVAVLGRHPDFLADVACERYTVTFNRGGYLRRL